MPLPKTVPSYWGVHLYTITQILVTVIIFVITFTKAAPIFPLIIIIMVPIRLLLMNRLWNRETLRFVDAWACKDGTPEDDEDARSSSEDTTAAAAAARHTIATDLGESSMVEP